MSLVGEFELTCSCVLDIVFSKRLDMFLDILVYLQ